MPTKHVQAARTDAPTGARHGGSAGLHVRRWREKRRLSQLALALEAEMSARHLSFVETGRAVPSPELLLRLAETLNVPLRERNVMLLAAGYAPAYPERSLTSPPLHMVNIAVQRLLDMHDPYPGVALDRSWDVVLLNDAARRLMALLPDELRAPRVNMFRASLHPAGFGAITTNFSEWARYLLGQLEQLAEETLDDSIAAVLTEVRAYPNVREILRRSAEPRDPMADILVPCVISLPGAQLSLFTTLATLGSPRDVTLSELTVELFYPADAATADSLRALST